MALSVTGGLPARLPSRVLKYASVTSEELEMRSGCFNQSADDVRGGRLCTIGAHGDERPSFIVWGDSHAARMAMPLAEIAVARGRTGLIAAVGSCPPLLDVQWPVQGCDAFNREVMALVERQGIVTVILDGMWASYAEGTRFKRGVGEGTANILSDQFSVQKTVEENSTVFARALRRTVDRLIGAGARVVIIGPVPEIESTVPEALAKAEWFGGAKNIGPSDLEFEYRQRHVFTAFEAVARLGHADVLYPSSVSCAAECAVERHGEVLYIDDNHLSRAGLDLMKPLLDGVFDQAIVLPRLVVEK
jgi:hypothetical protein